MVSVIKARLKRLKVELELKKVTFGCVGFCALIKPTWLGTVGAQGTCAQNVTSLNLSSLVSQPHLFEYRDYDVFEIVKDCSIT